MRLFNWVFVLSAISTVYGCSQLANTEISCPSPELSANSVAAIADAELKNRGISHYQRYRWDVFRVDCYYIYREFYMPETPGKWFDVVISSDGDVTEITRGK